MVIADVIYPILGMDFFQDGDGKCVIIDPLNHCLVTNNKFPVGSCTPAVFSLIGRSEYAARENDD